MRKFIFSIIAIMIILTGCSTKPKMLPAGGGENYVVIVQKENQYVDFDKTYKEIFNKIIYTPQPEHKIKFIDIPSGKLYRYKLQKNLLFVEDLAGDNGNMDIIKQFLTDADLAKVRNGTQKIFGFKDSWAKYQYILIVMGVDQKDLNNVLLQYKDLIFQYYISGAMKRLLEINTIKGLDQKAIRKMKGYGGFEFSLPKNKYIHIIENGKAGIMGYIRHNPDRMIVIAWKDSVDMPEVSATSLFAFRNKIFKDFFQGDSVLVKYKGITYSSGIDTVWNGMKVFKYHGLWQNSKLIMGGPFGGYALYHNGYFYMIDYNVANPGEDKFPLILEMEALLSTFKFVK